MRAIVKAAVQRELGIALIPVDEKLAFHMTGRVMVSTLPKEFKDAPEGILPAVEHEIANDPRLQGFFTHERVIDACGGVNAIEAWRLSLRNASTASTTCRRQFWTRSA